MSWSRGAHVCHRVKTFSFGPFSTSYSISFISQYFKVLFIFFWLDMLLIIHLSNLLSLSSSLIMIYMVSEVDLYFFPLTGNKVPWRSCADHTICFHFLRLYAIWIQFSWIPNRHRSFSSSSSYRLLGLPCGVFSPVPQSTDLVREDQAYVPYVLPILVF